MPLCLCRRKAHAYHCNIIASPVSAVLVGLDSSKIQTQQGNRRTEGVMRMQGVAYAVLPCVLVNARFVGTTHLGSWCTSMLTTNVMHTCIPIQRGHLLSCASQLIFAAGHGALETQCVHL
jgi:hypothetical protein